MNKQIKVPVLFLVFNRPDTTAAVFHEIRKAQPLRLYISGDGPRKNKAGESEKVAEVRKIVNEVDWPCEVKLLLREENLGCKHAVSSAITWFFEQEEYGIILEDDCLPSQSFFKFCEEMLLRYVDSLDIWHISGFTLVDFKTPFNYRYSRLIPIWGWATWKRAWRHYDINMEGFDINRTDIYEPFLNYKNKVKNTFYDQFKNGIDTWDIQWAYTCVANRAISIIPNISLIKNIGFNSDATHTLKGKKEEILVEKNEIIWPIKHPKIKNEKDIKNMDKLYLDVFYKQKFLEYIMGKIKKIYLKWKK